MKPLHVIAGGAGFGGGFSVIVLWGHDTMMLVWCVLSAFLFLVLFFYSLWSRLHHCLPSPVKEGLRV